MALITENPSEEVALFPERVARGVKWLDEHGPDNWREKVEINDLDMGNACRCILGQVFTPDHESGVWVLPGFWRVVTEENPYKWRSVKAKSDAEHEVTLTHEEAIELGFDCPSVGWDFEDEAYAEDTMWTELQSIWEEVLSNGN